MYDDFAVLEPEKFGMVAKEYNKKNGGKVLSVKTVERPEDELESIAKKFENLLFIVERLLGGTGNTDAIAVLNEIKQDIKNQQEIVIRLVEEGITVQSRELPDVARYCNNLKLALQVCGEIIKALVEVKDDDETSGEAKLELTNVINTMIDVNNKIVSLFGECRYRTFSLRFKR